MKAELIKNVNGCFVEKYCKYVLTNKPANKQEWFDIYVDLVSAELKSNDKCFALKDLGKGDFQDVLILKNYYGSKRPMFCDFDGYVIRKPTWKESEMRDIYTTAKWKNGYVAAVSYKLEVSEIEANIF